MFDIVRHLNIGVELIKYEEQKQEVARLNVLAGEKSTKSFSFHSAAFYFTKAISLQGELDGSEEHRDYIMNIYNMALNPLFVIGDFVMLENIIQKLVNNSRSLSEELNAQRYLVRLLAATGRHEGEQMK